MKLKDLGAGSLFTYKDNSFSKDDGIILVFRLVTDKNGRLYILSNNAVIEPLSENDLEKNVRQIG